MKEKQILVTQKELESIIYEEVQKERHMFYDLCLEDYVLLPFYQEKRHKGKECIIIAKAEWEGYQERILQVLYDLMVSRELIRNMEPVYKEYGQTYEEEHKVCFDDYVRMIETDYSAEEFERVRDRFEEEFYQDKIAETEAKEATI